MKSLGKIIILIGLSLFLFGIGAIFGIVYEDNYLIPRFENDKQNLIWYYESLLKYPNNNCIKNI